MLGRGKPRALARIWKHGLTTTFFFSCCCFLYIGVPRCGNEESYCSNSWTMILVNCVRELDGALYSVFIVVNMLITKEATSKIE